MLVRNYCTKCFKERFGNQKSICPAKEHPSWCKYGELCWVTPTEATEEIMKDIAEGYFEDRK